MSGLRLAGVLSGLGLLLGASAAPATAATAGQTFLASGLLLPAGAIAGGESGDLGSPPSVSDDGRYVAFVSQADALDPAAHPDVANVFRKDLETGAVVLVSRADGPNGAGPARSSARPVISDDGSRVAFWTRAALVPADRDRTDPDVYVRDVESGTTVLGSDSDSGLGFVPDRFDLSGDGRFVAFTTDAALVGADRNGSDDVYRRDLLTGTTALASAASGVAQAGAGSSDAPSISDDGRWVAFTSDVQTLVPGYSSGGGQRQVFVRDMLGGTQLVSANASSPTRGGNGLAVDSDVAGSASSASALTIAYVTEATDVAVASQDGDVSPFRSVYVRSLASTASTLVSRGSGPAGDSADEPASDPSIDDDGTVVAFTSSARNLGGPPAGSGSVTRAYLRHLATDTTRSVSAADDATTAVAVAGGGSFVAWQQANGATADSDPELAGVFGRRYAAPDQLGSARFVSRPPGSAPFLRPVPELRQQFSAGGRTISADGRYVVFVARDRRLPGSDGLLRQVYRRDLLTGAVELVSRANGADGAPAAGASSPSISADGLRVAFASSGALLAEPTSGSQAYVRDLAAGTTTLVSRADRADGAPADGSVTDVAISADGAHVAFDAFAATNLGVPSGGPFRTHVYLRDLAGARTLVVDRSTDGGVGAAGASQFSLSRDGRYVAFGTDSSLDPVDGGGHDVYVRDTIEGATTLVSRRSGGSGQPTLRGNFDPAISADGRIVAFTAGDETFAPEGGPWGDTSQVVARDLVRQQNTLVSRAPGGRAADAGAESPSVSGDGGAIAFQSAASNLVAGVGGALGRSVFARSTATGALSSPPAFGIGPSDGGPDLGPTAPSLSDDGRCLAFLSRGHNAVSGVAGDFLGLYVHVLSGQCPGAAGPPPAGPPAPAGPLGPPAPPASGAGPAKPVLSRLSLSRRRFRVGKAATAKTAAAAAAAAAKPRAAKPAPAGTAFRFTLNAAARVSIALERPAAGRRVGRSCRRASAKLRKRPSCTLFTAVATLTRAGGKAGANSVAFSGRIGRSPLKPGRYRASLRATNAAGTSSTVRLTFTIVKR